ncbi:hypothetical protein PQX77_018967 [Marasmius sp. AFHP31]|nr:hypothetical protein PQX77_018967 [Marasmius sp. AFHP31]
MTSSNITSSLSTVTPFASVLETNYVPSKQELNELMLIIHDPEEEIKNIDEEMSRLQTRRDELQQFVDQHRRLRSPSRRLPGDIWGEIFVHCLPDKHMPVRSTAEAPLLLTMICRSWRDIALRTPRLWNSLHLILPNPSTAIERDGIVEVLASREKGLKLWLERSGTLPLNLSLAMDDPLGRVGFAAEIYADCIGTIANHCTRWKSLFLSHVIPSAVKQFHRLSPENLPLLETFRDVGLPFDWDISLGQSRRELLQAVGNSPSLRKLHITVRAVTDFNLPIRWGNLRQLQVQASIDLPDCVSLVQKVVESCPILLECFFSFSLTSSDQFQPSSVLACRGEWNHLRQLRIGFRGRVDQTFYSAVLNIFESITTPVLTHLSLSFQTYGADDFGDGYPRDSDLPFHSLITRSRCSLKSLDLFIPLGAGLKKILNELPSLTTLSLSSPAWDPLSDTNEPITSQLEPVLQTLMSSEGESGPYPNIERLVFRHYPPQQAFALVDLIESRARSTRLRSLTVEFGQVSSNKLSNLVKSALTSVENKQLGVKIEWNYKEPARTCFDGPHVFVPPSHDRFVL